MAEDQIGLESITSVAELQTNLRKAQLCMILHPDDCTAAIEIANSMILELRNRGVDLVEEQNILWANNKS